MEWSAYEQTFGSLLILERIDAGFAQVSWILAQAFGDGKRRHQMRDFMPPWFQDLTEDEGIAQELAMLRGLTVADD